MTCWTDIYCKADLNYESTSIPLSFPVPFPVSETTPDPSPASLSALVPAVVTAGGASSSSDSEMYSFDLLMISPADNSDWERGGHTIYSLYHLLQVY
jgi:hypothetical protein